MLYDCLTDRKEKQKQYHYQHRKKVQILPFLNPNWLLPKTLPFQCKDISFCHRCYQVIFQCLLQCLLRVNVFFAPSHTGCDNQQLSSVGSPSSSGPHEINLQSLLVPQALCKLTENPKKRRKQLPVAC